VVVCSVCGEAFDECRYQVYSPGVSGTFDKFDCAARAVAAAARAARIAADERFDPLGVRLGMTTAAPSAQEASFAAALERGYEPLARYSPQHTH
jgi:hypothetical protein